MEDGFTFQDDGTLRGLIFALIDLINNVIPVLFLCAVALFIWGVIKYIRAAGDPKQLKEGRNYLIFGVIGFVVISGLWGILRLAAEIFVVPFGVPQFPLPDDFTE